MPPGSTGVLMHSSGWWVTVAALCALLVAGCTGSTEEPEAGAPTSSTVTVPDLAGSPERGTCWNVAADDLAADPRFDESPKVSCTQPHTTQTAGTIIVPEPTVAAAKKLGNDCWEHARTFIGVDTDHWIPWTVLMFLPSKQQIADGARWVRCDVGIPARITGDQQVSVTRSVESAALDPPADLWGCTLRSPLRWTRQTWHECDVEHAFEATGTLARLEGLSGYPTRAQRDRQGTRLCRQELTAEQRSRGLTALATWDPPRGLAHGTLVGICWAHHRDGRPLPPRP